jgi:hypothetical protein
MTDLEGIKQKMRSLAIELTVEFGKNYVLFALKKMNEIQSFELDIPNNWDQFHPILKVLDIVQKELEETLYHVQDGVTSLEEAALVLRDIIAIPLLRDENQGNQSLIC